MIIKIKMSINLFSIDKNNLFPHLPPKAAILIYNTTYKDMNKKYLFTLLNFLNNIIKSHYYHKDVSRKHT